MDVLTEQKGRGWTTPVFTGPGKVQGAAAGVKDLQILVDIYGSDNVFEFDCVTHFHQAFDQTRRKGLNLTFLFNFIKQTT